MSVIYVLLPLALGFAVATVVGFVWVVRDGQLDDLDGARWRVLDDDAERATAAIRRPR